MYSIAIYTAGKETRIVGVFQILDMAHRLLFAHATGVTIFSQ